MSGTRVCTRVLNGGDPAFQIVGSMNVMAVSFQVSSGDGDNATFIGNITAVAADGSTPLPSQAQTLGAGAGKTIQDLGNSKPVDGITITCVQGSVLLDLYF